MNNQVWADIRQRVSNKHCFLTTVHRSGDNVRSYLLKCSPKVSSLLLFKNNLPHAIKCSGSYG